MSVEYSYVDADSANLPKVSTSMLFDFMKDGRKFSYTEFEGDKDNIATKKYGDESIGYVSLLRNPYYCVVKVMIVADKGATYPHIAVRALIHETKNSIFKVECKNCKPTDCVHSFALLLWLHRRTEESVEQVINYYQEPGSIINKKLKQSVTGDHLDAAKSSRVTSNYLNNNNFSPDTKLFLHGAGIYSQNSSCSSQLSQTAYRTSQYTSQESSLQSNSDFELSQISSSGTVNREEDLETKSSAFTQLISQKVECRNGNLALTRPLPQKLVYETESSASTQPQSEKVKCLIGKSTVIPLSRKGYNYSIQLSQKAYHTNQYAAENSPIKLSYDSTFSPPSTNSLLADRQHCEAEKSAHVQPISQKIDISSTQFSQSAYYANQYKSENNSVKSTYDAKLSQTYNSLLITREHCEAEKSVYTRPPFQMVAPLSDMTNNQKVVSPKQSKTVRKTPYSQNNSAQLTSPNTLKKQSLLSKKVSQLVKQPKIDNFFLRPKAEVEDSKPQTKNLFMGELVKNFLKLNKGTVEDFMGFASKQMTKFLCREAEKLTRVQRTDLWMDLRYGRITASVLHEAANCRTINGSLVNKILGKTSKYQSSAMQRGIDLEDNILKQVQIQENIITKSSGLFLVPGCPIIGASPDAIGSDFIVEMKAPSSDKTFQNFLLNGQITKKCKSQMYLQMYCTGMKKGLFCVADPNFERNKKVTTVWLGFNEEEFNEVLEKAKMFWYSAIFPRLVNAI